MPPVKKKSKAEAAADVRTRIRRRAERDRWMKQNKKKIMYGVIGFFVIILAAVFSPVGPEYYYNSLQKRKMAGRELAPGYVEGLYKLGMFYSYTARADDAQRCFNEIGTLYFGFGILDYALNSVGSLDKRDAALDRIQQGAMGPPFKVPDQDLRFVGNAIWQTGELIMKQKPKTIIKRLYKDLFVDWFQDENPQACDKDAQDAVKQFLSR